MITSLKNDRVRLVRALQERRRVRQRERRFVVEGIRLCEEAARAGFRPHFVFYTDQARQDERALSLLSHWERAGVPCEEVSPEVMEACSDTETPQGLLAVVPIPELPFPQRPTLLLILDRIRDPGNLGTILRTAWAAGVEGALLAPGTVDATNPKAVRAGMGAHFHLPLLAADWEEIPLLVEGCRVYLADARGELSYTDADWTSRVALIVGGEAEGAGNQARALARATVAIPMAAGVESLNTAVAAAVLLFEAVRQRRAASEKRDADLRR
ncbi:MAG: RNA methyltransferase [Anaerolineae bacterium]|nr:RNA methyltransferase [Anaerolineae bacterium]MDW7990779.1 RNA methyltransferase [Anaerolineae bacterium]